MKSSKLKPFTTRLDPELIRAVKTAGAENDQPVQEIVDEGLRLWLSAAVGGETEARKLLADIRARQSATDLRAT